MVSDTRKRILDSAMRLFGEQGFGGTSIAQVESAAGLSPGAGGLYKHFASKDDLLAAGIRERILDRGDLLPALEAPPVGVEPERILQDIALQGLQRLDDERDLNRILLKDLALRPELLQFFRDEELRKNHAALAGLLRALLGERLDPDALAAILIDAISHYWTMTDIYGGEHPSGVTREAYLATLATLAAQAARA